MKVGSTPLSSPTVGRSRCPSVMTERLRAGFAFIMAGDRLGAHHKYMSGVAWHTMLCCLFGDKGEGYFVVLCNDFRPVCLFVLLPLWFFYVSQGEVRRICQETRNASAIFRSG